MIIALLTTFLIGCGETKDDDTSVAEETTQEETEDTASEPAEEPVEEPEEEQDTATEE